MSCYAGSLALLHRRRTGRDSSVDSALAYTATMLQSALLQDYEGKAWNEPRGQDATGSGPLNRLYEASDGWLFLAAGDTELSRCKELADLAARSSADLDRALEDRMRSRSVAAWVESLTRAGIGAHRVVPSLAELMTDPLTQSRGLGRLEFARMQELLLRYFPSSPADVGDIGGGPGTYACWLATQGYAVHLVDPIRLHVEQAAKHR